MVRSLLDITFHNPLPFASLNYRTPGETSFTVGNIKARNMDTVGISRSLDCISSDFLPDGSGSSGR